MAIEEQLVNGVDVETLEGLIPAGKTVFTHADREKLTEVHATVMELKELLAQVEPLVESFMGGNGAPRTPMSMILGSFMGGGR